MTDQRVERAFRDHPDFEQTGDATFETPEKPFETVVTVTDAEGESGTDDEGESEAETEGPREYEVVVRTPTLDAAVEGETVAEVVEDGWFETLELRLEDAHTVADTDSAAPPDIRREGEEVVVTVEFEREDPDRAAEDALAVAEYVEGTWVQGVVPGYDYRDPAASLLDRARQNYDEGGAGRPGGSGRSDGASGGSGGTPL